MDWQDLIKQYFEDAQRRWLDYLIRIWIRWAFRIDDVAVEVFQNLLDSMNVEDLEMMLAIGRQLLAALPTDDLPADKTSQ